MTNESGEKKNLLKNALPKVKRLVNRRNLILACSVLLLGCAVYLNWLFFSGSDQSASAGKTDDGGSFVIDYTGDTGNDQTSGSYFSVTQMNRQRARDEAVEVYQMVVDNEDALDNLKEEAVEGIARIASNIECESNIETLICAKGFDKCVAVISENFANIIIQSDGLLPNQVAQIQEIVCEQSGIDPDNIKIIEVSDT